MPTVPMSNAAASDHAREGADAREAHAPRIEVPRELDALLDLHPAALQSLYETARVPRLADIHGDLRGRMLAIPAFGPVLAGVARSLAGTSWFPWRGKSFEPRGEHDGEGINRVISDRWKLFRFTTFVAPSRAGGFDAVQLDYDHAHNPFFIRAIKDEIREIRDGLYLGQAYVHLGAKDHLALYFALERR